MDSPSTLNKKIKLIMFFTHSIRKVSYLPKNKNSLKNFIFLSKTEISQKTF